ncbi:MAG: endonuclease domain-containing protein [Deltaproteobacteria bacterium]|nr:endonuclease domain-containing protein [Deltaproteobacteria bacterium]
MQHKYNNPILKPRRQRLRIKQSDAEEILWEQLRNRQILNTKFYRQYSVGPYILDFFSPACRLAVELDGAHHQIEEVRKIDEERSLFLESEDIKVIRFWNQEVLKNIEDVLTKIRKVFSSLCTRPLS